MLDLVANRVPLPLRNVIAKRWQGQIVVMHEVDHPDGYVRCVSLPGSLRYGGNVWLGIGDLVSIDGLGGSRKTEVRTVTMTLSGVRPSQLAMITTKVRGRNARVSLAALRPNSRAVWGDVFPICAGRCDTQDHKIENGLAASIVLTVLQPIQIVDRPLQEAWTPDWLKATYGESITGLDDLPNVAARQESWTKE